MSPRSLAEARAAKADAIEIFSKLADVAGVGITRIADGYGLKVNLATPATKGTKLPASVHGVPVRVDIVGRVKRR
jgi:hypothetical protein